MSGQGDGHPLNMLSAYMDGELETEARTRVESHLRSCEACARALEDLSLVDSAVAVEEPPPVPLDLERKILERAAGTGVARRRRAPFMGLRLPMAAAAAMAGALALWVAFIGFEDMTQEDLLTTSEVKRSLPSQPESAGRMEGLGSGAAAGPIGEKGTGPQKGSARDGGSNREEVAPAEDEVARPPKNEDRSLGLMARSADLPEKDISSLRVPELRKKRIVKSRDPGVSDLPAVASPGRSVAGEPAAAPPTSGLAGGTAASVRTVSLLEGGRSFTLTETGQLRVSLDEATCSIQIGRGGSSDLDEGGAEAGEVASFFSALEAALVTSREVRLGERALSATAPKADAADDMPVPWIIILQETGQARERILMDPDLAERLRRMVLEAYRRRLEAACGAIPGEAAP